MWGTQRRYHADGRYYAWLVRYTAFINFFYFYCVDEDFGPFFIKFSTYLGYTAKLCINGNEWAKRQSAKAGIGLEPLDNGFAAVDDVAALQAICDSLGEDTSRRCCANGWHLAEPYTAGDEDAGYRYELSVLQAEFSLTQMLDGRGRADLLRAGAARQPGHRPPRPDGLVFARRSSAGAARHPGKFRTRVITDGVTP